MSEEELEAVEVFAILVVLAVLVVSGLGTHCEYHSLWAMQVFPVWQQDGPV